MQLELIPNIETAREPGTLMDRFERFHEANPHVYRNLVTLARIKHNLHPKRKVRINALYEILRDRYDEAMVLPEGEEYRLNNSYRSRYVRIIEQNEPDLRGAFEKRTLTARA